MYLLHTCTHRHFSRNHVKKEDHERDNPSEETEGVNRDAMDEGCTAMRLLVEHPTECGAIQ